MSWASIAGRTKKGPIKKLQVVYNIRATQTNKPKDTIPRQKEITPHPADDFTMTNEQSNKHKYSSCIELMHEWKEKLIYQNATMYLDFKAIEKDLRYQSKKYAENKKELSRMYFCCNDPMKGHAENDSLVHFLLEQLVNNRNFQPNDRDTVIQQILTFLKLLFKHNIVDINDEFEIWDETNYWIKTSLRERWTETLTIFFTNNYSSHIIDLVCDTIMAFINITKQSLLTINYYIQPNIMISKNILDTPRHIWINSQQMINQKVKEKMRNNGMIERLLFRGIVPFKFVEIDGKTVHECKATTVTDSNSENIGPYIQQLLKKINVTEKFISAGNDVIEKQLALLSPLILQQYINKARDTMNELLTQCIFDNGFSEIAAVISSYVFHLDEFYDKQIQNNINVKALVFLNCLMHFKIEDCKQSFTDSELIKYVVDNYVYTLSYILVTTDKIVSMDRFVILRTLIKTYNENSVGDTFPLAGNGIYFMIQLMFDKITWRVHDDQVFDEYVNESRIELTIEFMKYVKDIYGKKFDINTAIEFNETPWNVLEIVSAKGVIGDRSKLDMLSEFIAVSFKDELDFEKCFGVRDILEQQNFTLFKCYCQHYEYSLEVICEQLECVIHTVRIVSNRPGRTLSYSWVYQYRRFGKEFLTSMEQFCLTDVCKGETEKQLWQSTMKYVWNEFNNIKCMLYGL